MDKRVVLDVFYPDDGDGTTKVVEGVTGEIVHIVKVLDKEAVMSKLQEIW